MAVFDSTIKALGAEMSGSSEKVRFRLLRYFAFAYLLSLVVATIALSMVYRELAARHLRELGETNNVALTQTFENFLWPRLQRFGETAKDLDDETLRRHPDISELKTRLQEAARNTRVVKVKFYELSGRTLFSSDIAQIGSNQSGNPGFIAARDGRTLSELTHRDKFSAFDGEIVHRDLLSSYVPVRGGPGAPVEGVLEVYTDVTGLLARIDKEQHLVTAWVAAILTLLYGALFFIARRADGIINEQSEQSRRHREARAAAEAALHLRERAIEASANAIIILSASGPEYPIEYVNPAFERVTGYAAREVLGYDCRILLGDEGDSAGFEEIRAALHERREGNAVLRHYRKDGRLLWNDMYVAPVRDEDGEVRHFVMAQYDITAMKQAEAELKRQASHDALTGLPNRALLQDRIEQAIAFAKRSSRSVWVALIDLDRFKHVNDTLGHKAGDVLLQQIAARLKHAVRQADTVARLGGDEFVLILPEPADDGEPAAAPTAALQRILQAVAQPLTIDGFEFFPTCSIGVAAYPADGTDAETLLMRADMAMYRAKESGRNDVHFYTAAIDAQSLERLYMESELRHALERDQFVLHYQPQVDLCSGRVIGTEALIRWQHPDLGMVPPARFIGMAEETGLIGAIGGWVLRTACTQNKAWHDAGLGHLKVAVNLSARQFSQKDLVREIASILAETGLASQYLEIELTESLVMNDVEHAIRALRELKVLGVQLAIDDFGTGYSSLAYLKRFPIDVLKIDRSFVRDMVVDPDSEAIVASIISLSHHLQMKVVAEGVETLQQLNYLRSHGCDEVQGNHFSRPLPPAELEQRLHREEFLLSDSEVFAA